jgi:hypothetical protein
MWERFMLNHWWTKEYLENGDCCTPWPCFVIAVRDEIEKYPEAIKSILDTINETTKTLKHPKHRQDAG